MDLQNDNEHCGYCSTVCDPEFACEQGECNYDGGVFLPPADVGGDAQVDPIELANSAAADSVDEVPRELVHGEFVPAWEVPVAPIANAAQ